MTVQAPRSNPKKTYPRCHFNSKGKMKKQFESESFASEYITAKHLTGYTVYKCPVCNKYHISHKNQKKDGK